MRTRFRVFRGNITKKSYFDSGWSLNVQLFGEVVFELKEFHPENSINFFGGFL